MNNVDNKLLKNIIDEINRLNSQLEDLETYKDDFTPEEIEEEEKELKKDQKKEKKQTEKKEHKPKKEKKDKKH